MSCEVELPENEKEKMSSSSQTISFSSLPDEIIENILARISKWTYPNLSLVSKRFFTLLSSPQLYTTRSLIGTTEPCLYICLDSFSHPCPEWYTLSMKPHEILIDNVEIVKGYSLIPLHSKSRSPFVPYHSTVAVGSKIYVIGGIDKASSSSVRILDCGSDTWHDAPNMTVARSNPTAVFLDEKIYVMGGVKIDESKNWFEVFDVKTQTWSVLSNPDDGHELIKNITVIPGHLYVSCVIENVMYCFYGTLFWYDSEDKNWKHVKGLTYLNEHYTQIVDYGGKLGVMWMRNSEREKIKIWCANITLEKRHKNEIWGKTKWINIVQTVPNMYNYLTCVVVLI